MDWRDAYDTAIIERNFAIINGQEWQARAEAAWVAFEMDRSIATIVYHSRKGK